MATGWTMKENGPTNPLAPDTKNQKDLTTQLIISIALGLSAFIAFCVSQTLTIGFYYCLSLPSPFLIVPQAKMDGPLRRTKNTKECRCEVARATGYIFWMDTSTV